MTEAHTHKYGKAGIERITRIQPRKVPWDYHGTAGDKAFIVKTCECGDKQTLDYGPYAEIKEKLKVFV